MSKRSSKLDGSKDAKQLASAILEVLSGLRTPPEACEALSISLQRYYVLETRALQGLIQALEPRRRGRKGPKPETRIARLTEERDRLERELRRAQALVRVAQRAVGLPSEQAQRKARDKQRRKAGRKKTRKPVVRARKRVAQLRAEAAAEASAQEAPPAESKSRSA